MDIEKFTDVVNNLFVWYTIVITMMGIVCNPLSFIVFCRANLRKSTTSIYFRFLAIVDLGTILSSALMFIRTTPSIHVYLDHVDIDCRVAYWFMFACMYCSSWTLVAVTIERVFSIVVPHRVKILCSPHRAKLVILGMIAIFGGLSAVLIPFYKVKEYPIPDTNDTFPVPCIVTDQLVNSLMWWSDAVIFFILPAIILTISNIIIIRGVVGSREKVERIGKGAKEQTTVSKHDSGNNDIKGTTKKSSKEASMKTMLVLVNTSFIFLNLPLTTFSITSTFVPVPFDLELPVAHLLLMLMLTNHSLNFVLYCLGGSKFRSEAKATFKDVLRCFMRQP